MAKRIFTYNHSDNICIHWIQFMFLEQSQTDIHKLSEKNIQTLNIIDPFNFF